MPILITAKEPTLDAVQTLAQKNELPQPAAIDITALQGSTIKATFPPPSRGPVTAAVVRGIPVPAYSTEPDPWSAATRGLWNTNGTVPVGGAPAASSILSSGLPPQWWKGMEQVNVTVHGQQGPFFNRFMVYSVQSYSRGVTVLRRYSEFVFLWDCLVKRYPFRLLPQLPPKRIAGKPIFCYLKSHS
jgi:sorting nexin-8